MKMSPLKIKQLVHLEQLNFELLDTLELCLLSTKAFCAKYKIPFYDAKVHNLIKKAEMLIDEISPAPFLHVPLPSDDFLQRKKTDKDFTEPSGGLCYLLD
jgi:hypothetical protein